MKCLACWREAERIAKRSDLPKTHRLTKSIYLKYHLPQEGNESPTPQEVICTHSQHIKPGGYRRHKSGKVVKLSLTSRS
jgi:hypothetical protein